MNNNKPKILLFDIETAPNLGWVWGKYEQNVIEFKEESYLLCFAYKWLGEKSVNTFSLRDFKKQKVSKEYRDLFVVTKLWELFNEADIIIAHNGDSFDIKIANERFIYHGLPPTSPYKTIDTKKVAKRYFRFNSNKLDDLGQHLGLGRKIETGGFDLWKGCIDDDDSSWNKMLKYNKQDVILLEKVYMEMLPWIKNHPNIAQLNEDRIACPNCGSKKVQKRGIKYGYQQWYCRDCQAWPKSAITDNSQLK